MTAAVSVMLIVATLCIVFLIERTLGCPHAWQMNAFLHPPFQWSSSQMENIALWMSQPHHGYLESPGRWA